MSLSGIINKKLICSLKSDKKHDVLKELIDLIISKEKSLKKEDVTNKIFYRETLMSTGVGLGLGIPHIRLDNLKKTIVAVGINPAGIKDYESIDGSVIKIIFMIFVNKNEHKQYIKLLSEIVKLFKKKSFTDKLLSLTDTDEIYNFIISEIKDADNNT